jgi:hypothetical protein
MPADQTLTGVAGIGSSAAFGSGPGVPVNQTVLTGAAGIPSSVAFGRTDGVSIAIQTVPVSAYYAH